MSRITPRKLLWSAVDDAAHTYGMSHDDFSTMILCGVLDDCFAHTLGPIELSAVGVIRKELREKADGLDFHWTAHNQLEFPMEDAGK